MQASLAATGLRGIKVVGFAREYPAWRGAGQPGFIDFLAVDAAGRLHVVETKIGQDPMLVSQALDYATWVRARAAEIRTDLGWQTGDNSTVHIDLVVAPKGQHPALGPYTAGQLEALASDVSWRIHVVPDAKAATPAVTPYPKRTLPAPAPGVVAVTPARFARPCGA